MPQEPPGKGMLLIPDFSRDQNLSAPSQAIVLCPVSTVPGARAAVYLGQECSSIRASTSPALQSDPWRISIAPVTSSPPKTAANSQMFVCLLVLAGGKRAEWKFREMYHASFIRHRGSGWKSRPPLPSRTR